MKGTFITFEGPEGAGKRLFCKRFMRSLNNRALRLFLQENPEESGLPNRSVK